MDNRSASPLPSKLYSTREQSTRSNNDQNHLPLGSPYKSTCANPTDEMFVKSPEPNVAPSKGPKRCKGARFSAATFIDFLASYLYEPKERQPESEELYAENNCLIVKPKNYASICGISISSTMNEQLQKFQDHFKRSGKGILSLKYERIKPNGFKILGFPDGFTLKDMCNLLYHYFPFDFNQVNLDAELKNFEKNNPRFFITPNINRTLMPLEPSIVHTGPAFQAQECSGQTISSSSLPSLNSQLNSVPRMSCSTQSLDHLQQTISSPNTTVENGPTTNALKCSSKQYSFPGSPFANRVSQGYYGAVNLFTAPNSLLQNTRNEMALQAASSQYYVPIPPPGNMTPPNYYYASVNSVAVSNPSCVSGPLTQYYSNKFVSQTPYSISSGQPNGLDVFQSNNNENSISSTYRGSEEGDNFSFKRSKKDKHSPWRCKSNTFDKKDFIRLLDTFLKGSAESQQTSKEFSINEDNDSLIVARPAHYIYIRGIHPAIENKLKILKKVHQPRGKEPLPLQYEAIKGKGFIISGFPKGFKLPQMCSLLYNLLSLKAQKMKLLEFEQENPSFFVPATRQDAAVTSFNSLSKVVNTSSEQIADTRVMSNPNTTANLMVSMTATPLAPSMVQIKPELQVPACSKQTPLSSSLPLSNPQLDSVPAMPRVTQSDDDVLASNPWEFSSPEESASVFSPASMEAFGVKSEEELLKLVMEFVPQQSSLPIQQSPPRTSTPSSLFSGGGPTLFAQGQSIPPNHVNAEHHHQNKRSRTR